MIPAADKALDRRVSEDCSYVPKNKDQLLDWLRVVSAASPMRDVLNYPFHVVYTRTLTEPVPARMEIRIQGTLEDGSLRSGVLISYVSFSFQRVQSG